MAPHGKGEEASFVDAFGLIKQLMPGEISNLPEPADEYWKTISHLMDSEGLDDPKKEGTNTIRVRQMTSDERYDFSRNVDELATWLCHRQDQSTRLADERKVMRISSKALKVLTEKATKYFAESHGNHHAWVFGLDEEDPTTQELLDLKLVQRHGAGRSGHFRFSDVGHTVIVQNRSVEDGVEIAPQPARTSIHVRAPQRAQRPGRARKSANVQSDRGAAGR